MRSGVYFVKYIIAEILGYPLEEVHDEAERLEHFISERFEERIAAKLGNPRIDPHGHCIPELDGRMPASTAIPLAQAAGEGPFIVISIEDRDVATLKSLRTSGIHPGVRIRVRSRSATGQFRVALGIRRALLSPQSASAVWVQTECQ